MKLLLDQGLPRSTTPALAQRNIAAQHLSELGMSTATDEAVIEYARQKDLVIATLDADFHQLIAPTGAAAPSVIRIGIAGLKGDAVAAVMQQVLAAASAELEAGALVSVTPSKIRIRKLPLGS